MGSCVWKNASVLGIFLVLAGCVAAVAPEAPPRHPEADSGTSRSTAVQPMLPEDLSPAALPTAGSLRPSPRLGESPPPGDAGSPAEPGDGAPRAVAVSPPGPEVPAAGPAALPQEPQAPTTGAAGEPGRPALAVPDRPSVQRIVEEMSGVGQRSTAEALARSGRYLPMIREVFAVRGLPAGLAYLALVESHFDPSACSPAGAMGLWQFIESTARSCGLRVDWWVDERLDPEASTRAAAAHLTDLYRHFGDWDLALAAYNAGPGAVARALSSAGADSYWELRQGGGLREETRRYVPKFYAMLAIARAPERYGLARPGQGEPLARDTLWVDSPVDLRTVARITGLPLRELRGLNPALLRGCTPPGVSRYPLYVRPGWGERTVEALRAVPTSARTDFRRHTIRSGETLWAIARRYGTSVEAIADLNGVTEARNLRPGRELAVPVRLVAGPGRIARSRSGREASSAGGAARYEVLPGDTVWGIARRHDCSVAALLAANHLSRGSLLRPGDRLRLPGPGSRPEFSGEKVHVVTRGETLWEIARRYGTSVEAMRRRNGLDPAGTIRPGDRLVLPEARGGPS